FVASSDRDGNRVVRDGWYRSPGLCGQAVCVLEAESSDASVPGDGHRRPGSIESQCWKCWQYWSARQRDGNPCGRGCAEGEHLIGGHRPVAKLKAVDIHGIHFVVGLAVAVHPDHRRDRVAAVKTPPITSGHLAEFHPIEIVID